MFNIVLVIIELNIIIHICNIPETGSLRLPIR